MSRTRSSTGASRPRTAGPGTGPRMAEATLVARGVRVSRGGTEVLRGVDLAVHGGERLGLTGPSGAGKTVLLSAIAGLVAPEGGDVLLDGDPLGAQAAT